jgi:hypothetical protein
MEPNEIVRCYVTANKHASNDKINMGDGVFSAIRLEGHQGKLDSHFIFIIGGAVLSPYVSVQVPRYLSKSLALRPLWPIVQTPMMDEDDFWNNWWNEIWQGKPKYSEKTCPSATFVHHKISHA